MGLGGGGAGGWQCPSSGVPPWVAGGQLRGGSRGRGAGMEHVPTSPGQGRLEDQAAQVREAKCAEGRAAYLLPAGNHSALQQAPQGVEDDCLRADPVVALARQTAARVPAARPGVPGTPLHAAAAVRAASPAPSAEYSLVPVLVAEGGESSAAAAVSGSGANPENRAVREDACRGRP